MNIADILIGVGLLIGIARGFSTGFVRQVAGIAGLLLAFALGIQLMGPIGDVIADRFGTSIPVARLLTFILIVVAVHVLFAVLARVIEAVVGILRLTTVERALGGVLGGIKAAIIISIVLLVLAFFDVPGERTREASALYTPVAGLLPEAWDFLAVHLPILKEVAGEFGQDVADLIDIGSAD